MIGAPSFVDISHAPPSLSTDALDSTAEPTSSRRRGWIFTLVLVGLLLRAYPMLWGSVFYNFDQFSLHPDESKIVRYVDDFPGSLKTNEDFRYPLLMHHIGSAAWWPVKKTLGWDHPDAFPGEKAANLSVSVAEQRFPFVAQPGSMVGEPRYERTLLFLRGLAVLLFGIGGTWLLMAYGRRLGIPSAAVWIAAAASCQPWVAVSTPIVQTDTIGAFGMFAVFFQVLRIDRSQRFTLGEAAWLGVIFGVAVSARYTSGAAILAILLAAAAGVYRRKLTLRGALVWLATAGATAAATFLAVVPGTIYRFDKFKESLEYEFESKAVITTFKLDAFFEALFQCAPPWILVPTAIGAVIAVRKYGSVALLGAFLSLAFYFWTAAAALQPDYCLPLMPPAAVLTGVALCWLWERPWGPSLRPVARAAAVTYVLFGLGMTAATAHARYAGDTRYQWDEWVKENVPPCEIGFAPGGLARKRTSLRVPAGYEFVEVFGKPEWIVIPERRFAPIYNVYEDPNHYPAVPYDPEKRQLGYLGPREFDFFDGVLFDKGDEYNYELVKEFKRTRWPLDYPGFDIRMYRRTDL